MLLLGKQKSGGNFDILLLSSFLFILEKKKKKIVGMEEKLFHSHFSSLISFLTK